MHLTHHHKYTGCWSPGVRARSDSPCLLGEAELGERVLCVAILVKDHAAAGR